MIKITLHIDKFPTYYMRIVEYRIYGYLVFDRILDIFSSNTV